MILKYKYKPQVSHQFKVKLFEDYPYDYVGELGDMFIFSMANILTDKEYKEIFPQDLHYLKKLKVDGIIIIKP